MKKTKTMLFAILLAYNCYAQEFIEFIPSESTDVICNVLVSNNDKVEFDVELPGIFSTEIDSFQRVKVENHTLAKVAGSPEVPILSFLAAVPSFWYML